MNPMNAEAGSECMAISLHIGLDEQKQPKAGERETRLMQATQIARFIAAIGVDTGSGRQVPGVDAMVPCRHGDALNNLFSRLAVYVRLCIH